MTPGYATREGAVRYSARFPEAEAARFYRDAGGLRVSSLGLGTYLGAADDATDDAYAEAVVAAVCRGVNFLDAAINYRHQRSERAIGVALDRLFRSGEFRRDEIVVCTKAGFLTPGAVDPESLGPGDVVARMHSMAPRFLADQIDRSRANLGLETIDVFYLHNPETQLPHVDDFEARIAAAFEELERAVAAGRIRAYGTATWDGYRKKPGLDLGRLADLARAAGGDRHHFRFIQLPFNLAMPEALSNGVLAEAERLGITVVASATLLQARLARGLPGEVAEKFPGLATDAQRAIQFTRSTPGISVALVGMGRREHVIENLGVATVPPAAREDYL
ncbi:MAG: aldo/keto reductase, partial [Bryobacteraceae bacterium]